jgi:hypothetical protein
MWGMRRRICDHLVQVEISDDKPSRFRRDECEYEVVTFLKMLALLRPRDGVDTQLWQVRARATDAQERTYELQCDHGEWRMTAIWS